MHNCTRTLAPLLRASLGSMAEQHPELIIAG